MTQQRTIQTPIQIDGVGLHSGEMVRMSLNPAPVNTGIVFRRMDLPTQPEIQASASSVCDTRMCTALKQGEATVATVEHLMSALCAFKIDNLYIDINAPELPILDGSSFPYLEYLEKAGSVEQTAARQYIRLLQPIRVTDGDKWAELTPYDGFKVIFDIEYTHPVITATDMHEEFELNDVTLYKEKIAKARTYGFLKEYEWLKANQLARGGSLDNALVLDEEKILNPNGLRIPNEFVRHKILDAVGDLYLLGKPLLACYRGFKSGHGLNNQLARSVLAVLNDPNFVSFN